jgi:predicted kinase
VAELILIRGLPGSGKTTMASEQFPNHIHLETDYYFYDVDGTYNFDGTKIQEAHDWCYALTEENIKEGHGVVVSNTFTTWKELKPYTKLAVKYGCQFKVFEMYNEYKNKHNVPEHTIKAMKSRWETFQTKE